VRAAEDHRQSASADLWQGQTDEESWFTADQRGRLPDQLEDERAVAEDVIAMGFDAGWELCQ
jgi:hypothetical protein